MRRAQHLHHAHGNKHWSCRAAVTGSPPLGRSLTSRHGFDTVHHQIDNDLLKLDMVAQHLWKSVRKIQPNNGLDG